MVEMRRFLRLLGWVGVLVVFLIPCPSLASSGGIAGKTLRTASTGCGGCHGSIATPACTVEIAGPDTVLVGSISEYSLILSGGPGSSSGCNISAAVGRLDPVGLDLQRMDDELVHTAPAVMVLRSTVFRFTYTAPDFASIDSIFAVAVSADNDAGSSGDVWNQAPTKQITVVGKPAPLRLIELSASVLENRNVQLVWTTSGEVNNYGFFVERRLDDGGPYVELPEAFVAGSGTTTQPQTYSWTNIQVAPETYLYRIKQLDVDGNLSYSHDISVTVYPVLGVGGGVGLESYRLYPNYPNPFNPGTIIRYDLPSESFVRITVYNLAGEFVAQLAEGLQPAGEESVVFDGEDLPSGMYVYRLEAKNVAQPTPPFVAWKKMVLLK